MAEKALGMSGVSKSQVSRLCGELDERVKAFLERPIEGDWPYLWVDATYVKVREAGRIVSVAVIVAVGVNGDGRREVLGLDIGPSEAETFWTAFLRKLARRGLRGVNPRIKSGEVVSDAHEGLKAAVARTLNATWQRGRVHFMRNALAHAGRSGRRGVSAFIATAFPERRRGRPGAAAPRRRPAPPQAAQARRTDGRRRRRRARLHELPGPASHQAALDQSSGAAQRRDQAAHRRGRPSSASRLRSPTTPPSFV